jgi:hypothetical protein
MAPELGEAPRLEHHSESSEGRQAEVGRSSPGVAGLCRSLATTGAASNASAVRGTALYDLIIVAITYAAAVAVIRNLPPVPFLALPLRFAGRRGRAMGYIDSISYALMRRLRPIARRPQRSWSTHYHSPTSTTTPAHYQLPLPTPTISSQAPSQRAVQ